MTGLDRKLLLTIGVCGLSGLGVSFLAFQLPLPPIPAPEASTHRDSPAQARQFLTPRPVRLEFLESAETSLKVEKDLWLREPDRLSESLWPRRYHPSPLLRRVGEEDGEATVLAYRFRGFE